MKTPLFAGIGVILIAGFFYYHMQANQDAATVDMATLPTASTIVDSEAPGYALYTDKEQGIRFAFPTNLEVVRGELPEGDDALTKDVVLAMIDIPKDFESGTNFSGATFVVNYHAGPSEINQCMIHPLGASGSSTPVHIGSTPFVVLSYADASAGNRYEIKSYRTVHDRKCYAVEYVIHSTDLSQYSGSAVTEFNSIRIRRILDEIVGSFRFL